MAVIIDLLRTPIGKFGGALKDISAPLLGSIVIKELLSRNHIKADIIDEVIMGNVLQSGLGQNPARQSAILAEIPYEVPAFTVNKVCGSGLKAICLASQSIDLGHTEIAIAGGMENMSQAPYLVKNHRWGNKMGNDVLIDSMVTDGLWCALEDTHMGLTAENLAEKYNVSRSEQDEYATMSQNRAEKAILEGRIENEIVPLETSDGKKDFKIFEQDECPRFGTVKDKLSELKPVFKKTGAVTAGNSSGINDGAAAAIIMSEEKADALGLKQRAKIISYTSVGVEPKYMGMGAMKALEKILNKTGLKLKDIDLIEINEAFAAQVLAVGKQLDLDFNKVNVNGGAIAYGHPIGASGAKILVTLINEMERKDYKLGLASLCIGGGQGIAIAVER